MNKVYKIGGKQITIDVDKKYFDFYLENKKAKVIELKLGKMLYAISTGKIPVDGQLEKYFTYLERWKTEAPRKRNLREMKLSGMNVFTLNNLFEDDKGPEIINNLENTGVFAAYFLKEVYRSL